MPAGRLRQSYKSMGRLYRSSWTGAHEIFRAEEYDAGASTTHQASQHMEKENGDVIAIEVHWYEMLTLKSAT